MNMDAVIEHLTIVIVSVIFTIAIGVPMGVMAYFSKRARDIILGITDILQTIPALALLGIVMVFLGAGKVTVVVGLVLYSLLPVVRNTYLGLSEVDPSIKNVAKGMGMTRMYSLLHVEMPLAFPVIFTGIRIATVTSIGIAVFATSVGGGGLGSIINRGIYIQNTQLIMFGTGSLMIMAIALDFIMAYVEKRLNRRNIN